MIYVVDTDTQGFKSSIKNNMILIPGSRINDRDISGVEISDKFYFYIDNEKILIGPYIITSRCCKIENNTGFLTIPRKHEDNNHGIIYGFFFEPCDNVNHKKVISYPGFKFENDFFLMEIDNENIKVKLSSSENNYSIVIINESKFLFDFTIVNGTEFYSVKNVDLSQSWFKDIITLKKDIEKLVAQKNRRETLKNVYEMTEIIFSFLIKPYSDFWANLKPHCIFYLSGRANFIPFNWLNVINNQGFNSITFRYENQTMTNNKKHILRNAIIISDPSGSIKSAAFEAKSICDCLEKNGIKTSIISDELTFMKIKSLFENNDLIHFIGHGEKGWKLNKKSRHLSYKNLPGFISAPLLVVSNSCLTGLDNGKDTLVKGFIEKGVGYVIASDMNIPDVSFSNFFNSLYSEIILSKQIKESFFKKIIENQKNNNMEWIFYKLYE